MEWRLLAESVAGSSHLLRGVACQDAWRSTHCDGEHPALLIVVSDGAGSAQYAERGARIACDSIARQLGASIGPSGWTRDECATVVETTRAELAEAAAELGVGARELACTLLIAWIDCEQALFLQLGDGAIVIHEVDQPGRRVLFWPEPVEYANCTDFLTDDAAWNRVQFAAFNGHVDEVAVLTDGLQRLALDYETRSPFLGFFDPLFQQLQSCLQPESLQIPFRAFLESQRVNLRTDDDKTLVLASRRS